MSTNKSIAKWAGEIGLATSLSRVLGFIRDIIIARFFGTTLFAQAFVVAYRIPNLLRDLVGEGAVNAAFVPVLTDELTKKGKTDFFRLAQVVLNILFWSLIALTLIGIAASPIIVRLIAPGFLTDPGKFQITVLLTRILFPFLILVGLWAYAMSVLNSLGHFSTPAFGPCLLNSSIIVFALWLGGDVYALSAGVLVGGLLQLFVQFPPLIRKGWRLKLTREFKHPRAKRIGVLLLPRALGACVYQVNVFVSTILASLSGIVGEGAVAGLYYANRVWQLPLAVFGIAIAQAALPTMSKQAALKNIQGLKDTLLFSLRAMLFILIPSSVGLLVLSRPITKFLFERGAFTVYSTQITSDALFFYAVGLVACGGIKILVNAFYSLQDTMTPVKTAFVSLVVNVVLNLLLMAPLKVGGLALATSIAAVFNCILLYVFLRRKIGVLGVRKIFGSLSKILLAAIVMGAFCHFVSLKLNVIIAVILGIAVYIFTCFIMNCRELKEFLSWILKRK